MLSVTMWRNKKGKEAGRREIFFSCDDELARDNWVITIEYLKTKAIYDAYAAKNRNVGFNMLIEDAKLDQDNDRIDKEALLIDFGFNIKQRTTIANMNRKPAAQTTTASERRSQINNRRNSGIGIVAGARMTN